MNWATYLVVQVLGEPRGKGRPRFTKTGRSFMDKRTRAYEDHIEECIRDAMDRSGNELIPQGTPVLLEITAVYPRPKNQFGSKWPATRMPMATAKGDLDNVIKAISDATNNSGLWWDDRQVSEIHASRCRASIIDRKRKESEAPHVMVTFSVPA